MPNLITVLLVDTEDQRQALNQALVAICSYEDEAGNVIDAIDISYLEEFPELKPVHVLAPTSSL